MTVSDPTIVSLRAQLKAAREEFDMAIVFHEVWKPSAYDEALHRRMDVSFATHAFNVVRSSLRREMLLALMRLWDKDSKGIRMDFIGRTLSDSNTINALAADRAARFGTIDVEIHMRRDMARRAKEATNLIDQYCKKGARFDVLKKLRSLRHQRLAHREVEPVAVGGADLTDEEIESFYQDNSKIIRSCLSVAAGVGYDPDQTGEVYRHYAGFFWAAVCGERNQEHPIFRNQRE
jgi:AbiU2